MGFNASEDYFEGRRRTRDELVEPKGAAESMRALMLQHMRTLVEVNNAQVHAKLHYLETGEVLREDIRDAVPFIPRHSPSGKRYATARFNQEFVELPADVGALSDAEVLKAYGELLLRLREIRLPDPDPA